MAGSEGMTGREGVKLRICMLGHKRIPSREGGIEVVVEELAVRMAALGHDVTCYNRSGHHIGGKEFDTGILTTYKRIRLKNVFTINRKGLAAVTSSFFACLAAAVGSYEVVHVHAEGPAVFCWLPRLMGKRVILTVHGLDWRREKWQGSFGSRYIRFGEKMGVRWANEIIVLSKSVQQYFKDTYGRNTRFIPNGVTRPETIEPQLIQEHFGLKKDSYILYLGRIVPEKGEHYLIEAFKRVLTDKKLVIAGGVSDTDEYMDKLIKLAVGDERIIFTGFVQGKLLEELYSNAYIYVLPSDLEGMPLSLLEAMSYGNCCLVSNITECTDVIGHCGVSFRKSNTEDLRVKLQKLCDDEKMVCDYRDMASDYICRRYNWDSVVEQTLDMYKQQ